MRSRRLTLLAALAGTGAATVAALLAVTGALVSTVPAAGLPALVPAAEAAPTVVPTVAPAVPDVRAPSPVPALARPAATRSPAAAKPSVTDRSTGTRAAARTQAAPVTRSLAPVVAAETPAQRGARVLASLGYDWQRLGYQVLFLPARDGLLGLTNPSQRLVQVFVKESETDLVLAHTIAHELGHALDAVEGTAARRTAYLRLRGLDPRTPWFGCSGCTDYATPAGDWAEVFAAWLAGPGDFRSELAAAPTPAQLAQLAALFTGQVS